MGWDCVLSRSELQFRLEFYLATSLQPGMILAKGETNSLFLFWLFIAEQVYPIILNSFL